MSHYRYNNRLTYNVQCICQLFIVIRLISSKSDWINSESSELPKQANHQSCKALKDTIRFWENMGKLIIWFWPCFSCAYLIFRISSVNITYIFSDGHLTGSQLIHDLATLNPQRADEHAMLILWLILHAPDWLYLHKNYATHIRTTFSYEVVVVIIFIERERERESHSNFPGD